MTGTVDVTLPCGCTYPVEVPAGQKVGIAMVTCAEDGAEHEGAQLVTWRQFVVALVAPLQLPVMQIDGDDQVLDPPTAELPGARFTVAGVARAFDVPPDLITGAPAGPPTLAPGDVLTSPRTADEWKADAHRRGFSHAMLLQQARRIATAESLEPPRSLDDVDEVLTPLIEDWLNRHHPAPAAPTQATS